MPVEVVCPKCARRFQVASELAGKQVRCRAADCRAPFVVPAPPEERPPRSSRRGGRGGDAPGPGAGLVIALAVGGAVLLAALGGGGYLAHRALAGAPAPGQPQPGGPAGPSEVTVYPQLLRLDEPDDRFLALLVPSGRGALPVVVARPPDSQALRADELDWGVRRQKARSFELAVSDLDQIRDVRADGGLVAYRRLGADVELTALSAAGADVIAKGRFPTRGRDVLFVDRTRRVVVRENDAVELWDGLDEKKTQTLRAGTPGPGRISGRDVAVSPDGKTLAVWKGTTFDLMDLDTRQVRGRTAPLALQGEERGAGVRRVAFSPDGKRLLASIDVIAQAPTEFELACWDVEGGAAPRRFADGSDAGLWWGNGHVVAVPRDERGAKGRIYDAATGYLVCAIEHALARRASVSGDGDLWFLAPNGPETTFVARVPYPAESIARLAPAPGTTPVVRVLFQYPMD
jgi:hypothetical protein